MPDLLLELRSEEIPARMQRKAAGDLKARVTGALVDGGLTYEAAREYWTPRRLALDIRGVTARSSDTAEERKGPRTDAPEKAVQGFLRGAGLSSIDEAEVRSDPKKGDFYVAVIRKPGRTAEEIIAEALPGIIRDFPWPKSMRWGAASGSRGVDYGGIEGRGSESLRWVRPLQSIVCTFGPETEEPVVVDFEIDGIKSGNITCGHRFHAPDAFTVRRFDDYVEKLEKAFVVLDAERRKEIIRDDAQNLAFASGLELVEDEALLEEVSGLVEWPVALLGEFEEDFLQIPDEVIRLTIRANQKCFVTRPHGGDGLSNKFIPVANIEAKDGGKEIAYGNGKVVRARLSDALYFWNTDQADLPDLADLKPSAEKFGLDLNKPLDQRMAKLDRLGVTFHAKLGTQGARVERIRQLAMELAPIVARSAAARGQGPSAGQAALAEAAAKQHSAVSAEDIAELAARAAVLAKADLTTEVVGEFPELQGLIGRKYAELQGEHPSVAAAIEEHYKPLGPTDSVPSAPVSVAVALADKLDTLVGFWAIEEKPTGSKDPYALRRAALGVIRLVLENDIRVRLMDVFPRTDGATLNVETTYDLLSFFHDRLKVWLREQGARHDIIDAVITASDDDLLELVRRVEALTALIGSETGQNLLAGTKRAANILAAEEKKGTRIADAVDPALFTVKAESILEEAVNQVEKNAEEAIGKEDYSGAMTTLANLREPIDSFFEDVLVNDENEDVRANRLALLVRIRDATNTVADFSKLSG